MEENKTQDGLEELPSDYKYIRKLGKGTYGYVFEAEHVTSGKRVAIKKIEDVFRRNHYARKILREVSILRRLNSEFTVNIIDIIEPKNSE